jgi:hypothetical protein
MPLPFLKKRIYMTTLKTAEHIDVDFLACAKFPLDRVTIPRGTDSLGKLKRALKAPLTLKLLVGC